jgi:hypothetical protein
MSDTLIARPRSAFEMPNRGTLGASKMDLQAMCRAASEAADHIDAKIRDKLLKRARRLGMTTNEREVAESRGVEARGEAYKTPAPRARPAQTIVRLPALDEDPRRVWDGLAGGSEKGPRVGMDAARSGRLGKLIMGLSGTPPPGRLSPLGVTAA